MDKTNDRKKLQDFTQKVRTLGVACLLGFGGYGLSILWYTPYRLAADSPTIDPSYGPAMVMNDIALGLAAITLGVIYLRYTGKGRDYGLC